MAIRKPKGLREPESCGAGGGPVVGLPVKLAGGLGAPGPGRPCRENRHPGSRQGPDGDPRRVLVLATLNRAKGRELQAALADLPLEIQLLADLPGATLPAETGTSYAANALLKARAAARQMGALALADDSGLEVDAMGGAPGLASAHWGGADLDDATRCGLLLEALREIPGPRRTARFRCALALVDPAGPEHLVEESVDGVIIEAPRGQGGFGYDPVFFYPPLGRTFAELSPAEKARVSHRGRALARIRQLLLECYTRPGAA